MDDRKISEARHQAGVVKLEAEALRGEMAQPGRQQRAYTLNYERAGSPTGPAGVPVIANPPLI